MELKTNAQNNDIIKFWDDKCNKFPCLSKIAYKIFSIPATNLSSERNFNYCTLTLTNNRSYINAEKFNKILLFIRSNYDLL